ncbi:unnamed protein product [marine sediment metagenome]|uniref:Uncharacterized protein n=1 Tax=marine sediment metagenome TaxID=412755 RepID=X1K9T2_9ZZZZ
MVREAISFTPPIAEALDEIMSPLDKHIEIEIHKLDVEAVIEDKVEEEVRTASRVIIAVERTTPSESEISSHRDHQPKAQPQTQAHHPALGSRYREDGPT